MEEKETLEGSTLQPQQNSEKIENEVVEEKEIEMKEEPSQKVSSSESQTQETKKTAKEKKQKQTKEKPKKKKSEPQDEQNLSEEEIYLQVQTEKLLKRKKTKKIATIVSLCAAMVLAFCVIILAAVPVSMQPKCLKGDDIVNVTLYGKKAAAATLSANENEEKLDLFNKIFRQSFEQTCLSALFSGSLNHYDIDEKTYHSNPSVTNDIHSVLQGESYAGAGNYLVRISFAKKKTLTNQNGEIYKSLWGSSQLWDLQLKFTDAYVVVSKDGGLKDTKIFIVTTYPETSGNVNRLVCVTVKADTSKIYDAWDQFVA